MIKLTDNALQLPSACHQVSCHFERESFDPAVCEDLGIELPERVASAVSKRKAEFVAGRYCARLALQALGQHGEADIGIGERRAPLWPPGVVGSITHSKGYASAVLARSDAIRAIGIDSEKLIAERTAENVASHILTDAETYAANSDLVSSPRHYLTLIFSAKESIFKCLHPLVQQYFDFRDAQVELDSKQPGLFRFALRKSLNEEFSAGYRHHGVYVSEGDFVHTAVVLER